MNHSELRSKMQLGLKVRKDALLNKGECPIFEDGFYLGVEWATLDILIHHLTLVANPRIDSAYAIALLITETEQNHLLAHSALGDGLNCPACDTMNKMLDSITNVLLQEAPAGNIKDMLKRYGVSYIPEVPKEKQN